MYSARAPRAAARDSLGQVSKHSNDPYPHRLNFYDKPPLFDITLTEFETYAIDRLRILAEIESSFVRNRTHEELRAVVEAQSNKYLPLGRDGSASKSELQDQRRKDHISHFIMRLAFCRSEELRRRFVKAESILFKLRYETDQLENRESFLSSRNFGWAMVDEEELENKSEGSTGQLLKAYIDSLPLSQRSQKPDKWYKVRWTRIPDLVEKRRVVLKAGWAYVPQKDHSSLLFQEFTSSLVGGLEQTAKMLPRLDEDTRIIPILEHLGQGFLSGMAVGSEYTTEGLGDGEEITAEMIDDLAHRHWPLCMRHLHDCLRRDRHLRHFGRLQYGLFLKVVGLSIEEAIVFWRKAFGGTLTDDKFNKEHKYNIRHSYGLEGKRANYPAYSCQRIMTQNQPGPTDCHGCPYRHFSGDRLQTALMTSYGAQGLTTGDLPEIMNAVKAEHYHVACTKVFEVTHGLARGQGLDGESVTHPNQYAKRSRELDMNMKGTEKSEDEDVVMQ